MIVNMISDELPVRYIGTIQVSFPIYFTIRRANPVSESLEMVRMNSLADALRCINNAEKRGKRQVMNCSQ